MKKKTKKENEWGCCGVYVICLIVVAIFAIVSSVTEGCGDKNNTVYITNTGSKYHRGSCKWLEYSKIPISEKEAIRKGYDDCEVCDP